MNALSNFHTHTTWCDGKNTVREMIEEAIRLGCGQIGFSGHSPAGRGATYAMRPRDVDRYVAEVNAAKEEYRDRIGVFCGIEQDFYSPDPPDKFEYVIGSVHSIDVDGGKYSVDYTAAAQIKAVDLLFGGDFYRYTDRYFDTVISEAETGSFDIVGHLDIVAKFNEKRHFFDESDPRYKKKALEALEAFSNKRVVFEINSGAMSRGYRKELYPAGFILERISQLKMPVVFSSDCHNREQLLFGFEKMSELAKKYKLTVIYDMRDLLGYTRG